tara:strand:+ start:1431 stop:1793 length:363 start_codon:yes stop_codon:yes gene_type:complete
MEENRASLYESFSDLYLDTDVRLFYDRILDDIEKSKLPESEVRKILFDEVAPALAFNLECIAGEWAGFDKDWLVKRIEDMKQTRVRRVFSKLRIRGYTKKHWNALMKRRAHPVGGINPVR